MRRTLANLTSVVGGELLLRVANFVAAVLIARLYGAAILGIYATSLAFATLVVTVGDNGLSVSSVSETSRRPHDIDLIVSSLYAIKTLLFALATAVAVLVGWASHVDPVGWIIGSLVIAKVALHSYGQLHFGILKALDRMRFIGTIQLVHTCILIGGMAFVYRYHSGVYSLLIVLLVGQIIELCLSGFILWQQAVRGTRTTLSECRTLITLSTPIGLSCLLSSFILRLDILAVSFLYPSVVVGHFAAANNGVVAAYAVAGLFGTVLLPEMVKVSSTIEEYVRKWTRLVCMASIPATVAVALAAKKLVIAVYGLSFIQAGTLLAIMVFAAPLIFLNALYFNRAIALQLHRTCLFIYFGTTLIAIALDIALAKNVGLVGVAMAIVIREAVMLSAFVLFARRSSAAPATCASALQPN